MVAMDWTPDPTQDPASQTAAHVSASAMLGWDVLDEWGTTIGTLSDLLLDLQCGAVVSAEVASGGFLGAGEARRCVRWAQLQPVAGRRALLFRDGRPAGPDDF